MYQSLLIITALAFHAPLFAAEQKISQIFDEYSKKKEEFFKADLNKKNAKEKLAEHIKFTDSKYELIKKIENAGKETLLSEEGNQIAYDLELLAPVTILVNSKITATDCQATRHNNLLNSTDKKETDKIGQIIEKICK